MEGHPGSCQYETAKTVCNFTRSFMKILIEYNTVSHDLFYIKDCLQHLSESNYLCFYYLHDCVILDMIFDTVQLIFRKIPILMR